MVDSDYYKQIESSGNNYAQVIDHLVSSGVPCEKIFESLPIVFINKNRYNAFKYFYDKYLYINCRKGYEKNILCRLTGNPPSKYINKDVTDDIQYYHQLLTDLFESGVHPDQVCGTRCSLCPYKEHICFLTQVCLQLYGETVTLIMLKLR